MVPYEYTVEESERSASKIYYALALLVVLLVVADAVVYKGS